MMSAADCVLAVTGGTPGTTTWAVAAALLLVAVGGALLLMRRSRRAGLAAMGALVLLGGVVLAPIATAAPASAAQGPTSADCAPGASDPDQDPAPAPESPEAPVTPPAETPGTPVMPVAPTLEEADCGVEKSLSLPMIEGVDYAETRDGNVITVTAIATDGHVLSEGVETTWTFDVTPAPCACTADPLPLDEQFTMTYTPESQTAVSLGGFPAGWLAELDAAGATFSTSTDRSDLLVAIWFAPGVSGLDHKVQQFSQTLHAERAAAVDGSQLRFDLAPQPGDAVTPAETVDQQADAMTERLRAEYGMPELEWTRWSAAQPYLTTLTVTVVDSCGATQVRTYEVAGGGGITV